MCERTCRPACYALVLRQGYLVICVQMAIYRCLLDIAAGMDYLHSLGVLHGMLSLALPVHLLPLTAQ